MAETSSLVSIENTVSSNVTKQIKEEYPELEETASIIKYIIEDREGKPITILQVDRGFFRMFSPVFANGNEDIFFSNPNNAIVCESAINRYYEGKSPLGQQIEIDRKFLISMYPDMSVFLKDPQKFTINQVVKTWEGPSDFHFDYIIPLNDDNAVAFFKLRPDTDVKSFLEKFNKMNKYSFDLINLHPLSTIHHSETIQFAQPGNLTLKQLYIITIASFVTILCFIFNYISLFISRLQQSSRQLALRRVLGSSFSRLYFLMGTEIVLILFLSSILSFLLIEWLMPYFITFVNISSETNSFVGEITLYMVAVVLLSLLLALLPLLRIRKTTLAIILRDGVSSGKGQGYIQNSLLWFQLTIGVLFIFCTAVFIRQIHYLNRMDLGYDKKGLCFMELKSHQGGKYYDFSPEVEMIQSFSEIEEVGGYGLGRICGSMERWQFAVSGDDSDYRLFNWQLRYVTPEYFQTCRIPLIEGVLFGPNSNPETDVIINETAAKKMGFENTIGRRIDRPDMGTMYFNIIGIVKDTYEFLSQDPEPYIYAFAPYNPSLLYRYKSGMKQQAEAKIKELVERKYPGEVPGFFYTEDIVNEQNKAEVNFLKLLYILSFVCIAGSFFGIYAMVSLACERRRKEIAIRKINGASVSTLLNLFLKKYVWMLLLASVVAFCVGTAIMFSWLEQFMQRTTIVFWIYPLIFTGVAFVLSAIVVFRIWKSVHMNPSLELRKE